MSAHLVRSLLQRPILFNRALVDILDGSIYAALFLGQAIYWSERCDENGWFYKKAEEWEEETALSPKQQAGARTILRAKGYLSEKQDGGTDRKLFYSVDLIKLAADLQAAATSKALKRTLPTCLNGALEVPKAAASIDTETTTETTTETNGQRRPVYEGGFEQFWAVYPRKVAKRGALKAWVAAAKSRRLPPLDVVLDAIQRQGLKLGWFDGSCPADKVPHATTWLNQDRWNDELEIHPLPVTKPAPSPVDLAALDLKRAVSDAEKEIQDVIAPPDDGWTSKSRTVFFDHLDACKTEAEVADYLAACRALCDRLRALGAFPLRRATQAGEILPAGGGARIVVDLQTGFIGDTICPACGGDSNKGLCSCGDRDDPAVGGPPMAPGRCCSEPDPQGRLPPAKGDEAPRWQSTHSGKSERCPDGAHHEPSFSQGGMLRCLRCGSPLERVQGAAINLWWCCGADYPNHDPICPNSDESVAQRMEAHPRLVEKGFLPTVTPADIVAEKRRVASHLDSKAKVADGQHAYEKHSQSINCAHCGMPKNHIRHYLPQQLPFSEGDPQ